MPYVSLQSELTILTRNQSNEEKKKEDYHTVGHRSNDGGQVASQIHTKFNGKTKTTK